MRHRCTPYLYEIPHFSPKAAPNSMSRGHLEFVYRQAARQFRAARSQPLRNVSDTINDGLKRTGAAEAIIDHF